MAVIRQLLNKIEIVILLAVSSTLYLSCNIGKHREIKTAPPFCDSCEYDVVTTIFKQDSVAVFFKDYANLEHVRDTFQPINGQYLTDIDTSKYFQDSSITNHISVLALREYRKRIHSNPELPIDQYKDLKRAILSKSIIDSLVKIKKKWTYIELSKPLFGINNEFALIEVNYNCFGLCGEGYTYVLKKSGDHWTVIKKVLRWVS